MKKHVIPQMLLALEAGDDEFTIRERPLNEDYPTHFHDFYELEYVISGKGETVLNGNRFKLSPGSLIFVTPLDFQSITVKEKMKLYNLNFSEDWLSHTLSPYLNGATVINNVNKNFFEIIMKEFHNPQLYGRLYIKYILNCLFVEILRNSPTNIGDNYNVFSITQQVSHYIKTHFTEDINMDAISKKFGYTPNYISHLFYMERGMTIKEFTVNLRMDYALKKICSTEGSISDICFECGYNSFSNFLRTFKSRYGVSPKKYRALYKNGKTPNLPQSINNLEMNDQ